MLLKDALTIDKVLPDFMKFIEKSVLVAYNAGFDLGFLECALGKEMTLKVFARELNILRSYGTRTIDDVMRVQTGDRSFLTTVRDYKRAMVEKAIRSQKSLNTA